MWRYTPYLPQFLYRPRSKKTLETPFYRYFVITVRKADVCYVPFIKIQLSCEWSRSVTAFRIHRLLAVQLQHRPTVSDVFRCLMSPELDVCHGGQPHWPLLAMPSVLHPLGKFYFLVCLFTTSHDHCSSIVVSYSLAIAVIWHPFLHLVLSYLGYRISAFTRHVWY